MHCRVAKSCNKSQVVRFLNCFCYFWPPFKPKKVQDWVSFKEFGSFCASIDINFDFSYQKCLATLPLPQHQETMLSTFLLFPFSFLLSCLCLWMTKEPLGRRGERKEEEERGGRRVGCIGLRGRKQDREISFYSLGEKILHLCFDAKKCFRDFREVLTLFGL